MPRPSPARRRAPVIHYYMAAALASGPRFAPLRALLRRASDELAAADASGACDHAAAVRCVQPTRNWPSTPVLTLDQGVADRTAQFSPERMCWWPGLTRGVSVPAAPLTCWTRCGVRRRKLSGYGQKAEPAPRAPAGGSLLQACTPAGRGRPCRPHWEGCAPGTMVVAAAAHLPGPRPEWLDFATALP